MAVKLEIWKSSKNNHLICTYEKIQINSMVIVEMRLGAFDVLEPETVVSTGLLQGIRDQLSWCLRFFLGPLHDGLIKIITGDYRLLTWGKAEIVAPVSSPVIMVLLLFV